MKKAVMLKRMKMPRRRGTGKISHKRTTQGNFIALENQKIGSQSKQEKGYDNFPDHRNNACPICYITRGRQALFYSNYFFLIESCNIYCRFSLSLFFFLFCQTYNIQKFPRQRSNLCHISDQCHRGENAADLTLQAIKELPNYFFLNKEINTLILNEPVCNDIHSTFIKLECTKQRPIILFFHFLMIGTESMDKAGD